MRSANTAGASARRYPSVTAACVKAAEELLTWGSNVIHPIVLRMSPTVSLREDSQMVQPC